MSAIPLGAIHLADVSMKPALRDSFATLPRDLKFQITEFLDRSEVFKCLGIDRNFRSLLSSESLTHHYSKDLEILKKLKSAEMPTIEDFQSLHSVRISAFTEKRYESVVKHFMLFPFEKALDAVKLEELMASTHVPFLFAATVDCSLSVRNRFACAASLGNWRRPIPKGCPPRGRISSPFLPFAKPPFIIDRLLTGPGKLTDQQLNRSALPQYLQACAENGIRIYATDASSYQFTAGDWFVFSRETHLSESGGSVLPMKENALFSRIQQLAIQRINKEHKLGIKIFVGDLPETVTAPLFVRINAITGVEVLRTG